ncbi:hypothetical protein BC829DRAFT_443414 [Chytridium lagenaria]|nr:hypothetical protein BC829DRAFT_443414 [Chytridium lagenaria]
MPSKDQAVLYIFPRSEQKSTSQEAESVRIQALLLLRHIRIELRNFINMRLLRQILAGREIFDEVAEKSGNLSQHLTAEEQADVLAFDTLAETKLRFSWYTYALWVEPANVTAVAYPTYESNFTWPLNLIIPRIKNYAAVYEDARSALAAFSAKLDAQLYLFGPK